MAKKKSISDTRLLYLAILALALILLPVLVGAIQERSFSEGFAANNSNSSRQYDTQ